MNGIWDNLIPIQLYFEEILNLTGSRSSDLSRPNWSTHTWKSDLYRRADINVVDARDSKNLWMMHCCIFPHTHNDAPIFGFDIFAGKNKITGCFHDFSPLDNRQHPLNQWFTEQSKSLSWKRTRELPEWATNIFSDSMVAIGNVQDIEEVTKITEMSKKHLSYYLSNIGNTNFSTLNNTKLQNFYCQQQKLNSHNPRVLCALGLTAIEANEYIENNLFPEIV